MSVNSQSLDSEVQSLPLPAVYLDHMQNTQQNPKYHSEGNVLNHTLMVLDEYYSLSQQLALTTEDREVLYWAALLHDIGKPKVTRWVNNRWSAAGHEQAGVPIARDLLLQESQITPTQRRRILDLVRWHHLPLRFGLEDAPFSAYHNIAIKTDIKLLGLFSMMDLQGRICENRTQIEDINYHFNEMIVPYMLDYWGTYDQLQHAYSRIGGAAKNCIWYALKVDNFDLIRSILYEDQYDQSWNNTLYLTIGAPKSGKTAYIASEFTNCIVLPESCHYDDPLLQYNSQYVKQKIHSGIEDNQHVIIDGSHLDEKKRQKLTDIIREFDMEIHYLFFEKKLDSLIYNNLNSESPVEEHILRQEHGKLQLPHPWEAHHIEIISEPSMI